MASNPPEMLKEVLREVHRVADSAGRDAGLGECPLT
jgi:hypothetical protein